MAQVAEVELPPGLGGEVNAALVARARRDLLLVGGKEDPEVARVHLAAPVAGGPRPGVGDGHGPDDGVPAGAVDALAEVVGHRDQESVGRLLQVGHEAVEEPLFWALRV